ncbi:MAG: hypothetical protein NC037_01035 [Bacteroides sp.]|nr:hypothetical protein [Bacillota bacterium]MCM1393507.1 hypothetical protein [[Eubacterium] siraeum]MCM1455100.1 hypothetical protein [Bacteroides sp.]
MKAKSKKPTSKSRIVLKIVVALLCVAVLGGLGLSIAGNVLQYQKWQEITSAFGTPNQDTVTPLDFSKPITLRAGGEGQHLYINMDESTVREFTEKSAGFIFLLTTHPYDCTEENAELLIKQQLDYAEFFILSDIHEYGGIVIAGWKEDALYNDILSSIGMLNLYNYRKGFYGTGQYPHTVQVSDDGLVSFSEVALKEMGFDTVYITPFVNVLIGELEGQADVNSIEDINKVFAASSFGSYKPATVPDTPDEPNTPVEPPIEEFRTIEPGTPVSFRDDDGQHLYINVSEDELYHFKDNAGNGGFFLYAAKQPCSGSMTLGEILDPDAAAFMLIIEDNHDDNYEINIMFMDEGRVRIYEYITGDFGDITDGHTLCIVSENGQIIIPDEILDEYGLDEVYLYYFYDLVPEEGFPDLEKESCPTPELVDTIFAFTPFGN